jgi:hypothetical protein
MTPSASFRPETSLHSWFVFVCGHLILDMPSSLAFWIVEMQMQFATGDAAAAERAGWPME